MNISIFVGRSVSVIGGQVGIVGVLNLEPNLIVFSVVFILKQEISNVT